MMFVAKIFKQVVVLLVFSIIVLFGINSFQLYAQTLRIYHIDVEQGDGTLFISPQGATLLVDSGQNGHGSRIKRVITIKHIYIIAYIFKTSANIVGGSEQSYITLKCLGMLQWEI